MQDNCKFDTNLDNLANENLLRENCGVGGGTAGNVAH